MRIAATIEKVRTFADSLSYIGDFARLAEGLLLARRDRPQKAHFRERPQRHDGARHGHPLEQHDSAVEEARERERHEPERDPRGETGAERFAAPDQEQRHQHHVRRGEDVPRERERPQEGDRIGRVAHAEIGLHDEHRDGHGEEQRVDQRLEAHPVAMPVSREHHREPDEDRDLHDRAGRCFEQRAHGLHAVPDNVGDPREAAQQREGPRNGGCEADRATRAGG